MTASNQLAELTEELSLLRDRVAEMEGRRILPSSEGSGGIPDPLVLVEDRGDGTYQRVFLDATVGNPFAPLVGGDIGTNGDNTDLGDGVPSWLLGLDGGLGGGPQAILDFEMPSGADLVLLLRDFGGGRGGLAFDIDDTTGNIAYGGVFGYCDGGVSIATSKGAEAYAGMEFDGNELDFIARMHHDGALELSLRRRDGGGFVTGLLFEDIGATAPKFGIFDKGNYGFDAVQQGPIDFTGETAAVQALGAAMVAYGWLAE